jgi:hypothetical protein
LEFANRLGVYFKAFLPLLKFTTACDNPRLPLSLSFALQQTRGSPQLGKGRCLKRMVVTFTLAQGRSTLLSSSLL